MQNEKKKDLQGRARAPRTAGFAAGQVEDDGLDALARGRGAGSPRPAEVAERSHGFPGEVVGGEPVVVHHGEGQAGVPVPVLLRADVAARHGGEGGVEQSGRHFAKRKRKREEEGEGEGRVDGAHK